MEEGDECIGHLSYSLTNSEDQGQQGHGHAAFLAAAFLPLVALCVPLDTFQE